MASNLACVTALGLSLLLAGCTTATPASGRADPTALKPGEAVNVTCPISGRPVDPKVPGVEYEGRTIGFCSPVCISQWHETTIPIKDHFLGTSERKRRGLAQSTAQKKAGSTR